MANVEFPSDRRTHSNMMSSELDKPNNALLPSSLLSCVRSPKFIHQFRERSVVLIGCPADQQIWAGSSFAT